MAKQHPLAEDNLPSLLAICTTIVDMASRDNPGLNQTIGTSAQTSFIDQPASHDGLSCLVSVALRLYLQASLGRPAVLATPGQALALYESWFGKAHQSGLTCCVFMDDHVYGGVTFV